MMPWKGEKNPYRIWISEIILQQTRVKQGLLYYERFIQVFPNVQSLAIAPEQEVYKMWEGLGYYSRCKNLIATAKYIAGSLDGNFPDDYDGILALKGVGPYTASAISSFAFGLPYAVVDGNVMRVLARFFGIETPINSVAGKKIYENLARELLDKNNAGVYNQAIMDFGAVICKPALPLCTNCPLKKDCTAFNTGKVKLLPVNEKKIKQKHRFFNYFVVEADKKFYVKKRTEKDIWQNLYEFILIESDFDNTIEEILNDSVFLNLMKKRKYRVKSVSQKYRQKLTHQAISGRFFHLQVEQSLNRLKKYSLLTPAEINQLPFPKFITSYLKDKNVSLSFV